jgi:hypothetical protein
VAQVFLAVAMVFYVLPSFGLRLLDTARDLAALDVPRRLVESLLGAL